HPGGLPLAQLLDVQPRQGLRGQRHERLRRAPGGGVSRRVRRLHRHPPPARGRHRLLRPHQHHDLAGRLHHGAGRVHRRGAVPLIPRPPRTGRPLPPPGRPPTLPPPGNPRPGAPPPPRPSPPARPPPPFLPRG